MKQITEHFNLSEFTCHCGRCTMPQSVVINITYLVKHFLEPLRCAVGVPVRIMSGYRCRKHNQAVGGATRSQHMFGCAADIHIDGMTAKEIHAKILELFPLVPGLGLYRTFVHIDCRNLDYRDGRVARW